MTRCGAAVRTAPRRVLSERPFNRQWSTRRLQPAIGVATYGALGHVAPSTYNN